MCVRNLLGFNRYSFFLSLCLAFGLSAKAKADESYISYPILPAGVTSITVSDSHDRYVGRILPQKRYWVTLDHIPVFLQQALLSIEDARFYEHGGIDLQGIARALLKDVTKGKMAEGGSTITQQLIKNKFLSNERTLDRKLTEARMAMEFEKKYTKRQILEMYFNEIYFGNGAQGIVQAARLYFDKRPEELNDGECLLLAGVPKNPNRYNPFGKPAEVLARRDTVLTRMTELNVISAQQKQKLQTHTLPARVPDQAPSYLANVRAKLVELYGADVIEQGGLQVTAALDLDMQKKAEQILKDGVNRIAPELQGALICLDPTTGDVLAAVGGVDNSQGTINRAFSSRRQPGSAIKPLIYAAAVDKGTTASSIWNDEPAAYDSGSGQPWRPMNFGKEAFGDISLRKALAVSNNVITVKLLDSIGVPYFVDFAGKMGLKLHEQNGLSLALGTEEVTLKDLVQAYSPFATGGIRSEARTILRIHNRRNDAWTDFPPLLSPVLSSGTAFITTQMMKDVLVYGTAKSLKKFSQEHACAGKTGTTDDEKDAWFIGFTPSLVTGIWVGYDRPRSGGSGFTGGTIAAPIWERFMRTAAPLKPGEDFTQPDTVVTLAIDPTNGCLATESCPKKADEYFLSGTEPMEACPEHPGSLLTPPPAPPADLLAPDPVTPF